MVVGLLGPFGQTVTQILVEPDTTEDIEYVIIQLQGGEAKHALVRQSKRISVPSHVQVTKIK